MRADRLIDAFICPTAVLEWTKADWSVAVRQARSANLLAALGKHLESHFTAVHLPEVALRYFQSANNLVLQRNAAVIWEVDQVLGALNSRQIPVTFLKGAAYVLAGLPLSAHRHFSDVDLMVNREDLPEVEKQLMLNGWLPTCFDSYDQRYYRKWMHEVPPLRHIRRGTVLDLHHAITPLTAKYQANTAQLIVTQVPVEGHKGAYVLGPTDMVLHAVAHLFAEGEAENALRNLLDISELIDYYQSETDFDAALAERSFMLGLSQPLYLAAHYLVRRLKQDRRKCLLKYLKLAAPNGVALVFLDAIYDRVFQGGYPTTALRGARSARFALYLRAHWLRMPIHLLLPHLFRKLIIGYRPRRLWNK